MAGTIIEVDPSTLTIALNVRRDVKLDKEFVASIRQHGVLQPPMVVRSEGVEGYDVVLGQRRVLAAAQAKLPSIEAYLVDRTEAEAAARVVDQLTENEQRQNLSDVERVGGYKELALFGISPAEIAKRTNTPKARVDAALSVADSAVATKALESTEITLDQAAEIVEFEDDKAAVKLLTDAATNNPGSFAHVVKGQREKRELAVQKAAVEAEVQAAGGEVLKSTDWANDRLEGWTRLDSLGTVKDPAVTLPRKSVAKDQLGGRAVKSWKDGGWRYEVQWFVRDGHAFPVRAGGNGPASVQTPEDIEREKKWAAEQAERQERQAVREAANAVRWEWLATDLLQRAKLPEHGMFVALALTLSEFGPGWDGFDQRLWEVLGVKEPVADDADETTEPVDEDEYLRAQIVAKPTLAPRFVLLSAVLGYETAFGIHRDAEGDLAQSYLQQLVEWGYGLSEYEAEVVAAKETAAA